MAITHGLISLAEYSAYTGASQPIDPVRVGQWEDAVTVASRWVEHYTARQFHDSGATPSARYFSPRTASIVSIDDCRSVTSVAFDADDNGTHGLTITGYQLLPAYGRDTTLGEVPYTEIKATSTSDWWWAWPTAREGSVKVVGLWGWSSVPATVKRATATLAQDLLRDPESAFGGLGIAGDGVVLGARIPARVTTLLAPFVRLDRVLVVG